MTYRDDREALHARAEALEAEVEALRAERTQMQEDHARELARATESPGSVRPPAVPPSQRIHAGAVAWLLAATAAVFAAAQAMR